MPETLSIVIPSYSCGIVQGNGINNAIKHYRNICDELIVVEDGGIPPSYSDIDTLVIHKTNRGFTKAVNNGWKIAQGDYVAIVNSDTYIEDGDIRDLCVDGIVTHPRIVGHEECASQFGAFFVVPKTVSDSYGYLDERFVMYYSDDDYRNRIGFTREVPWVTIRHAYGFTTNTNPDYYKRISEEDRVRFEEVWDALA